MVIGGGTLRALPTLANELDDKTATTSLELILGSPPPQRDPFNLPPNEHEASSRQPSNRQHDPDSGVWTRSAYGPLVKHGMTTCHTDSAWRAPQSRGMNNQP